MCGRCSGYCSRGGRPLSRRTWLSATNSPSCGARSNALVFAGGIVASGPGFSGSGRMSVLIHFNVTESLSAKWTAQQIVEAFPWDSAPRYLLRDRDGIYGHGFINRVDHMGIKNVKTAP